MAKDVVEIFAKYAKDNEFYFTHGSRNVINLLQRESNEDNGKVYLLLEEVKRESEIGDSGLSRKAQIFSGRYILGLSDDYASNAYNENNTEVLDSQYQTKIKPLLTNYKAMESLFIACEGYEILSHFCIDLYNVLDVNLTGLLCTFRMRVYEN